VTPGNRMIKYADDTYNLIPACNILSRVIELEHVAYWAHTNNLKLNKAKSVEIVFTDSRRKSHYTAPLILPDICRVTSIKVLGVTFTNHVSISEHISDVICRCAQSLYAIKVLRCHGMNDEELRLVFKTVVLAKILYATPAWWGFTSAADRQRLEAFVRRCVRLGLYRASDPTLTQFIADNDDNLFRKMLYNEHHVLNNFFLTSQIISITLDSVVTIIV